jgi:[ribosomal protein S5]-alanine N-acetyltransferase
MIKGQLLAEYADKKSFAVIWFYGDEPVGHSNISPIHFGEEAFVHLHIWNKEFRGKGDGLKWLKKSLPYYFEKFKLKRILCEPYALNPAPNRMVEKLGFDFVKEYTTIPGWICFEQPVKRWVLTKEKFDSMQHV